jgi:hypothetical protein
MDDFAQNIDVVHAGGELQPRLTFPEGFLSTQGQGSDKNKETYYKSGSDKFSDKGWKRDELTGLDLKLGQESAVAAAMMIDDVQPGTLEYADRMSIHHLHTLFDRRMALRNKSCSDDGHTPGPVAGYPTHHTTPSTQQSTSLTGGKCKTTLSFT